VGERFLIPLLRIDGTKLGISHHPELGGDQPEVPWSSTKAILHQPQVVGLGDRVHEAPRVT
jgi:hypothetical protein